MAQERTNKNKLEEKETTAVPQKKQRALIFQGGGALGAYEAGVYRVLYDWISKNIGNKDENFFDVIAGTSIGALNGAIIVSHVLEKKKMVSMDFLVHQNIGRALPKNWRISGDTYKQCILSPSGLIQVSGRGIIFTIQSKP